MNKQYLNKHDLAVRWGISQCTLQYWRNKKGLPFIKKGRSVVYNIEDVKQYEKKYNLLSHGEKYLSQKQLAGRWGVSTSILIKWRNNMGLPSIKKGYYIVLFHIDDVKQYEKKYNLLSHGEKFLTTVQLACRWKVGRTCVNSQRGRGLPFIKKMKTGILYRIEDVEQYEKDHGINNAI